MELRDVLQVAVGHDMAVRTLVVAGLGLDYGVVRLERTTEAWIVAGAQLRDRLQTSLGSLVDGIEQVGSSSVRGLLAKPIVDLAAGVAGPHELAALIDALEPDGWIYRGDAGDDGGHVFVLEARPWHRVAHLHIVEHEGPQWRNYLRFRDLLRRNADARSRYEAVKAVLAEQHRTDRTAYTTGKSEVVNELLAEFG